MSTEVESVKASVDLVRLVETDLGPASKQQGRWWWWHCPFHPDDTPSFGVTPDNGRWKCFGCGKAGDHADWLVEYRNMSTGEALSELRHLAGLPEMKLVPTHNQQPSLLNDDPPPISWQQAGQSCAAWAQKQLWTDTGRLGLAYLEKGGLTKDTVKTAGLGWNPNDLWRNPERWGLTPWTNDSGRPGRIWIPRGLVIPCVVDGNLWYIKVRRFDQGGPARDKPKYVQLRGSRSALFGADDLRADGRALLLCEGERDCLLARQELSDKVDATTIGGAGKKLSGRWLLRLLPYRHILAAYDADSAGRDGAAALATLNRRIMCVRVPYANDVTDFHMAGGDLRVWLNNHLKHIRHSEKTLPVDPETEVKALLDQIDTMNQLEWCRQWADMSTRLDQPCTGYPSWAAWLADIENGVSACPPAYDMSYSSNLALSSSTDGTDADMRR